MDIYASDEEKAEAIKQWWRENGRSVVAGVLLGGAAIFGFRYWTAQQQVQAEQASALYQQAAIQLNQSDVDQAAQTVSQLQSDFSSSAYAVFSALELAQASAVDDVEAAKTQLNWVIDNAKLSGHRDLARLRLAQLELNDGDFENASALTKAAETDAFTSLFAELEGDIAHQQGDAVAAREAYQRALLNLSAGEPRQSLLQLKLDDVAVAHEG